MFGGSGWYIPRISIAYISIVENRGVLSKDEELSSNKANIIGVVLGCTVGCSHNKSVAQMLH